MFLDQGLYATVDPAPHVSLHQYFSFNHKIGSTDALLTGVRLKELSGQLHAGMAVVADEV